MSGLGDRTGKWFKVDPDAKSSGYVTTIDSKNKILGNRGLGGPEISGHAFALFIDGRTYIFAGYNAQILDDQGNGLRSENGRQGYYGYRWYNVHFDKTLEDGIQKKKFVADDLTNDDEHKKAVEIAVEFLSMRGLLNMKVPPIREIEFSKLKMWFDPRNPNNVIKVNQDAD